MKLFQGHISGFYRVVDLYHNGMISYEMLLRYQNEMRELNKFDFTIANESADRKISTIDWTKELEQHLSEINYLGI